MGQRLRHAGAVTEEVREALTCLYKGCLTAGVLEPKPALIEEDGAAIENPGWRLQGGIMSVAVQGNG
jgi:hypothetical protein